MLPDPPPLATSTAGHPSWMAPIQPAVPDHELLRRIGGGSYGDVWLARNVVGTWRAVKVVFRDRFTDERPYEREFNGMLAFEPLSRSNEAFIDILQIGRNDAEGYFYYVMELADDASVAASNQSSTTRNQSGVPEARQLLKTDQGSLNAGLDPTTYVPLTLSKALLQRARLPLNECLELGLTLNLGLAHLHRAGLIHRDIKPSNIIFVGGVPKLADIGLVIETSEARSYVGTEGFIPPEGPTSPQADLYSLGKVLYEAGMGKDRKDFPEPMTQIAHVVDGEQLLEFNAILLRSCAANRTDRYQSAEEMNADLALIQSGGSVRRQRRLAGQLRTLQRAGALITLLATVIALGWWWQVRQTRLVRQLASEKSALAGNLARLDEENRQRIVRLDIANGVRLLDEDDPAGALLWFAEALPRVPNKPAEESIHRIRIQQTLNQIPHPTRVLVHPQIVTTMAFSPDGRRFATGTEGGWVHLWDASTGRALMNPSRLEGDKIREVGFTPDGQRLLASTMRGGGVTSSERINLTSAVVIDVASGRTLFSRLATNFVRAEFKAGGRWFVMAGQDHVIRVVDVRDGHQVAALNGHTNNVLAFSSSNNGDVLASASEDGTTRLWRLPDGKPVGVPLPFDLQQHFPVVSPDGQRLATREQIGGDGTTKDFIRIWRTDTLESIGKPIAASGTSGAMWFDQASNRRLFSMFGGQLQVFETDTQADLLRTIRLDKESTFFAVNQDTQRFMAGGRDRISGLWNFETGEVLAPPFRHGRKLLGIDLSPDGSQLATLTDEGVCVLWKLNLRRENAAHQFSANFRDLPSGPPQKLLTCFSPDRRRFLIPLADRTVRLVKVEDLAEVDPPEPKPANSEPVQSTFSADNRQWAIAYASTDDQESSVVELWRDEEGKLGRKRLPHPRGNPNIGFAPHEAIVEMWRGVWRGQEGLTMRWRKRSRGVQNMRFASGGASLITVGNDRQIRIWRTKDGTLERSETAPETIDEVGDVLADGRTLFVAGRGIGFALFDLVNGSMTPISIGPGTVTAFALDPAGERFATVTEQQGGRVWSTATGAPLSPLVRHDGPLTWVDWSPDGKRIAMAGTTSEVRVWDASTGDLALPPLRLDDQPLGTVMWSLDGRFLVSRSGEKVVRVWDSTTGEAVTPLLKHSGDVRLAHLVANNRLITLSLPNVMRAWDLAESKLPAEVIADYAKLVAGRRFNAAGVLLPLKPDELLQLARSLHSRAPQLFE